MTSKGARPDGTGSAGGRSLVQSDQCIRRNGPVLGEGNGSSLLKTNLEVDTSQPGVGGWVSLAPALQVFTLL